MLLRQNVFKLLICNAKNVCRLILLLIFYIVQWARVAVAAGSYTAKVLKLSYELQLTQFSLI